MSDDAQPIHALDPAFFEGRLMIDILSWDWNLRVAINATAMRPRTRFQGLDYGRDFTLHGRVRTPRELRGRTIKVTLSPFGPKVRFGRGGLGQVGRLKTLPPDSGFDFEGVLMLPEDAIATTATSLASTWKHLQVHTFDDDPQQVAAYFFSAAIHPTLAETNGD
jgi:hypothetical protein